MWGVGDIFRNNINGMREWGRTRSALGPKQARVRENKQPSTAGPPGNALCARLSVQVWTPFLDSIYQWEKALQLCKLLT